MIIDCAAYEDGRRVPGTLPLGDVPAACQRKNGFVWLGLFEPTAEEFAKVAQQFELHELAVEDAISAHQRPKLEIYDESVFVVLKTARYIDETEAVEVGEIMMFVGDSFIVVVRHGEGSPLTEVRKRLEAHADLARFGPSAVAYAVVDRVVDDYTPVIEGIDKDIREVEIEVFSEEDSDAAERIYKLKREVLELEGAVLPLAEPLQKLAGAQYRFVPQDLIEYYRDVHDHVLREIGSVQNFRDLLTSVLEANLTRVSVRQNEDMRKISAWVAIAAVPTMIAGIYGMNFDNMPELDFAWGYPIVLAFIATVCLLLYRGFRTSGWL